MLIKVIVLVVLMCFWSISKKSFVEFVIMWVKLFMVIRYVKMIIINIWECFIDGFIYIIVVIIKFEVML